MILIACPIKDRAWAVPYWFDGIANAGGQGHDLHVAALVSQSEDDTEHVLKDHGVEILYDERVGRPIPAIIDHLWTVEHYEYMATLRNRLVEFALEMDADYFFSVDSDIMLPHGGLDILLRHAAVWPGAIAPAVNMAHGGLAWNVMNWDIPGMPHRNRAPSPGRVDVVMGAILLDRSALECRWYGHGGGEDIGFSLDCEEKGVARWWVPEVRCRHLMEPVGI